MSRVSFAAAVYTVRGAARLSAIAVVGIWLGGCAISMPLGPIFGADSDTTGSIPSRDGRFSNNMNDTDWAQARDALARALEQTDETQTVRWENPQSGLKGAIAPLPASAGQSDPSCRTFVATLIEGADTHWYRGQACRRDRAWTVTRTEPWTNSTQNQQ